MKDNILVSNCQVETVSEESSTHSNNPKRGDTRQ